MPKLDDFVLPIGKAKIARDGKDVTIVSFGIGMTYALKAAEALAGRGDRGGGDRPSHHPPDGHRHGDRIGEEDQSLRDGGGGLAAEFGRLAHLRAS